MLCSSPGRLQIPVISLRLRLPGQVLNGIDAPGDFVADLPGAYKDFDLSYNLDTLTG